MADHTHSTPRLSAAARRQARRQLALSSNRCADCNATINTNWRLVRDIPTCQVCGGTRPLGGTIPRSTFAAQHRP